MLPTLLLVSLAAGAAPAAEAAVDPARPREEGALALLLPARREEGRGLALPLLAARGGGRGAGPLRDDEDWPARYDEDDERRPHLVLSGWGGEALASGGSGRSSSFYGGEAAWVFSSLDLGVAGSWYRALRDASRAWTPVLLTRVTQRFTTRRGFEATFSLGFGAGRPAGWIGWYQAALGVRIPLGPLFLGGELAFEQYDIIRLGAGLGVGF